MKLYRLAVAAVSFALFAVGCAGGCGEKAKVLPAQGPLISGLSPAQGPTAGGSVILIKGERFAPEAKVVFGKTAATKVTVADPQTLTALVPAGEGDGAVDVQVQNSDGNVFTFTHGFTYYTPAAGAAVAPTLTQLSPNQGPLEGGALIELRGDGFQKDAQVFIGGRPARSVTFVSAQLLTAVTPSGVGAGAVEVAVTNADGQSSRLDAGYAYSAASGAGPRVTQIAPNQGSVLGGEEVRITGADFQTGVRVYIGGRPATGVALLGNEVVSLSPAGEPGLQDVAVVNPDGQTFISPRAYNFYSLPPRFTSITPIQGPKTGGTDVVILGRGFDNNTNVLIDGKPVTSLTIVDSESATAKTPEGEHGGYVDCKVIAANGLSDTAKGGFYFIDQDHPPIGDGPQERLSVIRVSPSSGPIAGGTPITLLGAGFKAGATVNVGGKAATEVHVLGPTAITAKTPSGTVGAAIVEVVNPDGQKADLQLGFTYYGAVNPAAAPTISGIAPNTGPTTGQTRALLNGSNFKAGVRVFLGEDEASGVVVISPTQLTFTTPAVTDAGPVNVTVLTTDGLSGQLTSGFVYYVLTSAQQQNAPVLTDVTPPAGPAGVQTSVAITGDKFQSGALVFFGNELASGITVESNTGMHAVTPAGSVGPVDVTVTNPDGLSVTKNAGYNFASPAPSISSITPNSGPLGGNITALIVGTGFVSGAEVLFGSSPSSQVQITDGTIIRAQVPPNTAGAVDVTVRNPDGQQSVLTAAFTYDPNWVQLPAPSLDQILPMKGPSTGGTVALLRGQNFVAGASVFFGNTQGTEVVVSSATEASVKVPAGAEGAVHVTFTNPDGQSSVLAAGFTWVNPATLGVAPKLTGVTPTSGPESAPTNVLVTGQNLKPNALIFFGGVLAKNPVQLSANIYSAQTQPQAAGQVSVSITHPDGQSYSLPNAFTFVPHPTVTGVLPPSGKNTGGTQVTLSGTGFQPGATVTFGTANATAITVASATVITCTTPAGSGVVDITVKNPDNQLGTLTGGFTYVPPPSFATTGAVVPAQGPSTGGSIIELHGAGFQNGATVNVRGTAAQVQYVDATTLVISTPANSVGNADIQITNPDGQTSTLTNAFIYKDPASLGPAPTLTAPTPAAGPNTGNSRIIVNGGSFVDGAHVFFGMLPGQNTAYVNPASIGTTTPASAVGKVVLAVTNPDGQTARLTDGFEFKDAATMGPAPTVTLITPQSASRFGGTSVSVTGTNFLSGATLFLGGLPATNLTVTSSTQIDATAPAHQEGPALVQVTNADGQTATFAGTFQFVIPPPQIASVTPGSGPTQGGTTVDVNGTDMHPQVVVTFGTATATCTWVSSSKVTCTTPPGSNGPVAVKVTNPDGKNATLAGGFTYAAPPTITAVSPTSGPEAGGTRITITGQNFKSGAAVQVGTVAATAVTFVSSTAIQATTPAGTGPAAVKVINPDSQFATMAGGFTYLPPVPPPTISGVSPNYGPDTGGTNVTISGSGFQAGATVYFGTNTSATVQVFSPTYINAVAPAGTVGTVDLKIVNPDSQQAVKTGGYQYIAQGQLPPLAVDQVSPARGPLAGGNVVNVLGRGFKVGAIVAIGGNACTNPQYIGPGAISCTVPAGPAGPAPVQVTNPGGTSATLNAGYIYGDGGGFTVATQRLRSESLGGKRDTLLIDVDGDGDLDQISTYDYSNRVEYNDGTGTFIAGPNSNILNSGLANHPNNQYTFAFPPVDLTGDGKPDIVVRGLDGDVNNCWGCGYSTSWNLIVFKNNGGTFTEINRIGDSSYLSGPMIAVDVDNDGDKDIVWGRDTPNVEVVFKNNGSGVFTQAAGAFPAGIQDLTRAICAGDVDKDGDQDLFVANDQDQQKRLYLNNGTGVFTDVSSTYLSALGGNSQGCAMADIDKDNDLDIFIINNGQQDRLYINDGTGHFTDGTLGRMPQENDDSSGAELVDIDFDGDLDLISRVGATKHERVYLSDGNGQFVPANADLIPAVVGPDYWWRVGDVNKDGYPDIIRAHQGGQNRLLINQPNGSGFRALTDRTMISFPSDWRTLSASAFIDVDGDGDQDLVAGEEWTTNTGCVCMPWGNGCCSSNTYDGRIHLYLNDGSGNFFEYTASRLPPNISVKADSIAVADFDGVNGLDFAVNDRSQTQRARLFLNDGTGNFSERSYPNFPSSNNTWTGAITTADLDGDGRPDLLLGTQSGVRYWRNVGSGYFVDMSGSVMPSIGSGWSGWVTDIAVGDLDNDSDLDLFVSRYSGNQIIKQDPGFVYTDYTSLKMPSASAGLHSYLFDADNDGDLDAYVANCTDDRLYLNTGGAQGGYMADNTNTNLPRVTCSEAAAVLDINGDGLKDLYIGKSGQSSGNEQDRLLINGGAGSYTDQTTNRVSTDDDWTRTISIADVNGDGRLDLFIGNSGQSRIYRGVP